MSEYHQGLFEGKITRTHGKPSRLVGGPLKGDDPRDGLPGFRITGTFGKSAGFWANRNPHSGVDLGAPKGTQIVAPADGRFVFAQANSPSFGRWAVIEHTLIDGSKVYTAYCHMDSWADWWSTKDPARSEVKAGQSIGKVGDSGEAYGAHLHWGMSTELRFPHWTEDGPLLNALDWVKEDTLTVPKPDAEDHTLKQTLRDIQHVLEAEVERIDRALDHL